MSSEDDGSSTDKREDVATTTTATASGSNNVLLRALCCAVLLHFLYRAAAEAYDIRLYAIKEYGRVIHEFDPYFNYRATEYLYEHGWKAFCQWFDYMVWYPLGRPVGTTIYPGMQVTSVFIKNHILPSWSINDICCFVPAWFGVSATLAVAFLTYECTNELEIRRDRGQQAMESKSGSSKTGASKKSPGGAASATSSGSATAAKSNYESILNSIPAVNHIYRGLFRPIVFLFLRLLLAVTKSTWGLHPRDGGGNENASSGGGKKQQQQRQDGGLMDASMLPATGLSCAVMAGTIMSIVPAHISRSVAGGYDNESIAMTAMVGTFACWTRALRNDCPPAVTCFWGCLTGLAYFYMVAAWGGYVFVLNMIGVHASVLVCLLGRYSTKLYLAYSCFYVVGTALAIQVPIVGWTPLKSLEQLGPFAAFGGMQLIQLCQVLARRQERERRAPLSRGELWTLRAKVFGSAALVALVAIFFLAPTGYFGPISSRVRGLFVKHTKTGNPLVDSVAEHQPASPEAYWQYLNEVCYIAPVGYVLTALFFFNDSSSFLLVYASASYFLSHKMVRLILLTAPIASVLGGIALGRPLAWGISALTEHVPSSEASKEDDKKSEAETSTTASTATSAGGKKGRKTNGKAGSDKKAAKKSKQDSSSSYLSPFTATVCSGDNLVARALRVLAVLFALHKLRPYYKDFYNQSHEMARAISHPTIIQKGRLQNGQEVTVDDYREAYFWLDKNTPKDARIMAWWDYGYQITGIGNRTTIADGNTWNHEHIALLGRTLTAQEREAHRIARHLADYVLIWAGGGGDDLAKSPHLRRIANSVYRGLCAEPTCRDYGFYSDGSPTQGMQESLLYKLHGNMLRPGVEADRNRFKEVYRSKYGKVRIYKILKVSEESKKWVANPENRVCDAPGSWFCRGQYPPALTKILKEKRDFKQLEDFNIQREDDSEYQKQYMENLQSGRHSGGERPDPPGGASSSSSAGGRQQKMPELTPEVIDLLNEQWENSEVTTLLWEIISQDRTSDLRSLLRENPHVAHVRSEDGRGPMWWAYEYGRTKMIELLKKKGVSDQRTDDKGMRPVDL